MRTLVVSEEDDVIVRTCACGLCHIQFAVRPRSRRIYYNTKHQLIAKDARREARRAQAKTPA